MGFLDIPPSAASDSAVAAAINGTGTATKAALTATYSQRWKASTAYTVGQPVVNPNGDLVTAIAAHTSGTTYNSANWNLSTTYATPADAGRSPVTARKWPQLTILSDMSSGWSANFALTSNVADTSDYALGTSSVYMTTNTTAGACYAETHSIPSTDMTGRGLIVWMKIDSTSDIANIVRIFVDMTSDASGDTNFFRANFYAGNNKLPIKVGEWYPLQISNAQFRTDGGGTPNIAAILGVRVQVYAANGVSLPIRIGGVASYSETSQAWPNGVISLCFDDSPSGGWTYAVPKLASRGWAGTLFPIIGSIDTAGSLTMAQVQAIQNVYGWEIGAHATTTATHVDYTTQTTSWIRAEQLSMRRWQQANNFRSSSFAYPIGPYSAAATQEVAGHWESARSTGDLIDSVKTVDLQRMGSLVCNSSTTLATAKARVDAVVAGKGWLKFTFHNIVAASPSGNDWLASDFNSLMDYIASKGIPVARIADVLHPFA